MKIFSSLLFLSSLAYGAPFATDCHESGVTYQGIHAHEVEGFVGIRFAQDTGGEHRFKPPRPYIPTASSTIDASETGPACPQQTCDAPSGYCKGSLFPSFITDISEDCLRLNVWRPNGTKTGDKLPVLAYIYGGGFTSGSKDDILQQPGGLILQSIANGYPVMAVELNYRLGVFGFAQSTALEKEGSENAGLRDQRLALEWVQDNIASFGGDPSKITIHGQSSGGLAVGMQIMAFGASRSFPFQQAVCQSQALEPGITGNFTREAMAAVQDATDCKATTLDSATTVDCLRKLPMHKLLNAQLNTASSSANLGDQWLPVVDGEEGFLPAAPSTLFNQGRFGNINTMIGWCDNDALLFTPSSITTPQATYDFISNYLPAMTDAHVRHLLSLYPPSEFWSTHFPNGTLELHSEVYRAGRILRDILFTCQPILYGHAIANAGNDVYFYDQNQTLITPLLNYAGIYGEGVVHTSELLYVFGNLSKFDIPGLPYHPTASDFQLRDQESRSWSTFAALGQPSLKGRDTLAGWRPADFGDENYGVYVIGGPNEGYSGSVGSNVRARNAMMKENLKQRCDFLNSPEIVKELQY